MQPVYLLKITQKSHRHFYHNLIKWPHLPQGRSKFGILVGQALDPAEYQSSINLKENGYLAANNLGSGNMGNYNSAKLFTR